MRAAVVVAVAGLAAACGPGGGPSTAAGATLAIVSLDPLTVRGTGFRPGERVRVLVAAGGRKGAARAVRASGAGGFTVRLGRLPGRAGDVAVQAAGDRGSRAEARVDAPADDLAPGGGMVATDDIDL